jgi:hypothetical protein
MLRQRQVLASLLLAGAVVFVLGLGALAQSVSLTVTTYSDAVRFSAQGAVKELRVEVLSLSGQKVFDSGPVLGNALDWKLSNTQGQPVANGVYLYTVTVKDPSGNVTKKLGKLAVLRGKGVAAPPLSGITIGEIARTQPTWNNCGQGCAEQHNGDVLIATTVGTPWAKFDSALQRLGIGTLFPAGKLTILGPTPQLQVVGNDGTFNILQMYVYSSTAYWHGDFLDVYRARGTRASPAIVQDGDRLFGFEASGYDGTAFQKAAAIQANVDGPPSTGIVPGRWEFVTTDTSGIHTTRMVVKSDGNVGFGTGTSSNAKVHINNTANQPALRIDSSAGTNALEIYNTEGGQNLIFRVERTTGNVYADGNFTGGGADVAERIDVSEAVEPGDVVEIDPDNPGKFRKAREALSTRVAGVISTAPGVVLGNKSAEHNDARPIFALAGRVPVKVTAKYGAIAVGDLLVSSPIPGYAMKCPEKSQCIGAVIGKALEPLAEGSGLIEVQIVLR